MALRLIHSCVATSSVAGATAAWVFFGWDTPRSRVWRSASAARHALAAPAALVPFDVDAWAKYTSARL
eukprot:scaffold255797_cov24-Attheya_sp.AAC.1